LVVPGQLRELDPRCPRVIRERLTERRYATDQSYLLDAIRHGVRASGSA